MDVPDLHEILKLALRPRYSFAIWVTALLILVVPLPAVLLLDDFRQQYGKFLGIAALLCFVVWVVEMVLFFGTDWIHRQRTLEYLQTLNSEEQFAIARAVFQRNQTVILSPDSHEANSLVSKGLLLGTVAERNMFGRAFTIPTFVWKKVASRRFNIVQRVRQSQPNRAQYLTEKTVAQVVAQPSKSP
jgi:hypothetical protein